MGHLFFAVDARIPDVLSPDSKHDDLEVQQLVALTTEELEHAILHDRAFKVHSWAATMSTALLHWHKLQSQRRS